MLRTFSKLALAALISATAASASADTLVDNVQGITINADGKVERFIALVIADDGKVRATLNTGDVQPEGIDFRVDGEGRVMLPGMIDSHVHVMGIGFGLLTLDLSGTNSLEEAQAAIKNLQTRTPPVRGSLAAAGIRKSGALAGFRPPRIWTALFQIARFGFRA